MIIFAYRTVPVTILIAAIYISIFFTLLCTNTVPDIPKDTHGLDLEQAYIDLHHITKHPHPYHSHANDLVRSYLRSRIDEIIAGCEYARVEEDLNTTAWLSTSDATVVFQASNIMVKIDGYDNKCAEKGGVLFSAHYDSVSTAFGTTDNGIAVVSLLQIIDHLVKNRPRRTAIFNINNGEEDGLNGAQAFLQHPWSRIPDTFINLEGAGAGGPPLLFRATSLVPVKAFARGFITNSTTYRVSHPHGNVLSADAFQRGVVRSRTDYSIYNSRSGRSMEGVDLAFYKSRSRYHTMFDSIPGAKGEAKKSLWAMLENAWAAGGTLLNIELTDNPSSEDDSDAKPVVYFDLFKRWFLVFEQRTLHIFNLTLLLGGPLLVLFLHAGLPLFCGHFEAEIEGDKPSILSRVFAPVTRWIRRNTHDEVPGSNTLATAWSYLRTALSHVRTAWAWGNVWIPLVVFVPSIFFILSVTRLVLAANRYIAYSQPYTVMSLYLTIILVVITFLLGSPSISAKLRSTRINSVYVLPDRQATFIHLYIFTYLLLVLASLALSKLQIGGLYWISAWHAGICAACIIGGMETFNTRSQKIKEHQKKKRRSLLRRDANRGGRNSRNSHRRGGSSSDSDEDATEATPLLPGSLTLPEQNGESAPDGKDSGAWWILQVLFSIPVPVMLIGHVLLLFQDALGQTLSDGSSAGFVYLSNGLLCFFIVLPIAPFASGIHRYITYIAIMTFLGSLVFNLATFPFSQDTPLKVLFQQFVQLNSTAVNQVVSNAGVAREVIRTVTSLTGVNELVKDELVPKLPSSWGKDVQCTSGRWIGLTTCSWESGLDMIPHPGGPIKHPWLTVDAERLSPTKARITVKGKNARICRVYFDEMQIVEVLLSDEGKNPTLTLFPMPLEKDGGILRYWSRQWGKRFTVDLDLNENVANETLANGTRIEGGLRMLRGRVACEWAEYESGMVGLEPERAGYLNPKMPALEEVFRFLPQWAIVTKAAEGLVEAWSEFEV